MRIYSCIDDLQAVKEDRSYNGKIAEAVPVIARLLELRKAVSGIQCGIAFKVLPVCKTVILVVDVVLIDRVAETASQRIQHGNFPVLFIVGLSQPRQHCGIQGCAFG